MKLKHEELLLKSKSAQYSTPCGKYEIYYTNYGFLGEVVWMAKDTQGGPKLTSETLQALLYEIVKHNPHMILELYKILYNL